MSDAERQFVRPNNRPSLQDGTTELGISIITCDQEHTRLFLLTQELIKKIPNEFDRTIMSYLFPFDRWYDGSFKEATVSSEEYIRNPLERAAYQRLQELAGIRSGKRATDAQGDLIRFDAELALEDSLIRDVIHTEYFRRGNTVPMSDFTGEGNPVTRGQHETDVAIAVTRELDRLAIIDWRDLHEYINESLEYYNKVVGKDIDLIPTDAQMAVARSICIDMHDASDERVFALAQYLAFRPHVKLFALIHDAETPPFGDILMRVAKFSEDKALIQRIPILLNTDEFQKICVKYGIHNELMIAIVRAASSEGGQDIVSRLMKHKNKIKGNVLNELSVLNQAGDSDQARGMVAMLDTLQDELYGTHTRIVQGVKRVVPRRKTKRNSQMVGNYATRLGFLMASKMLGLSQEQVNKILHDHALTVSDVLIAHEEVNMRAVQLDKVFAAQIGVIYNFRNLRNSGKLTQIVPSEPFLNAEQRALTVAAAYMCVFLGKDKQGPEKAMEILFEDALQAGDAELTFDALREMNQMQAEELVRQKIPLLNTMRKLGKSVKRYTLSELKETYSLSDEKIILVDGFISVIENKDGLGKLVPLKTGNFVRIRNGVVRTLEYASQLLVRIGDIAPRLDAVSRIKQLIDALNKEKYLFHIVPFSDALLVEIRSAVLQAGSMKNAQIEALMRMAEYTTHEGLTLKSEKLIELVSELRQQVV